MFNTEWLRHDQTRVTVIKPIEGQENAPLPQRNLIQEEWQVLVQPLKQEPLEVQSVRFRRRVKQQGQPQIDRNQTLKVQVQKRELKQKREPEFQTLEWQHKEPVKNAQIECPTRHKKYYFKLVS